MLPVSPFVEELVGTIVNNSITEEDKEDYLRDPE